MLALRIRTSALALAGAALLSTTFLAPFTAAAAPITAGPESLTGLQPIKLARADIRVEPSNKSGSGGQVTYRFLVTNAGPDDIRFHVRTRAYFHDPASSHMQSQDFETDLNLQHGKSVELAVACNAPGDVCYSGHLHVDKVYGIDPDMTNNYKIIHAN
jgi:hypothetical protein